MKKLMLSLMALATAASAQPGTYEGKGKVVVNGKVELAYTAKLVIDVIEKDKVVRFTDSVVMSNGEKHVEMVTLRMGKFGLISVESEGKVVGDGQCVPVKAGSKWCDFRATIAGAISHVNFFYDGATKAIYRLGDFTDKGTTGHWNDALVLK